MARLVLIAAPFVLLLGACGLRGEEQLARALVDDADVRVRQPPSTVAATTTDPGGEPPPGEAPGDLGDEAPLDDLAGRCFTGDMAACDDLYFESPLGSDYETYGSTCGGRNEATVGGCATRYGGGDAGREQPPRRRCGCRHPVRTPRRQAVL